MRFLRFYDRGSRNSRRLAASSPLVDEHFDPTAEAVTRSLKFLYRLTLIKYERKIPVALEKIYETGYRIVYWTGRPCKFDNMSNDHSSYWSEWKDRSAGFYYISYDTKTKIDPANPGEFLEELRTFLDDVKRAAKSGRKIRDFVQEYPALSISLPQE